MQTANSQVNFSPASDIIGVLQNILAHSQIIMPDLETPYSRASLPNTNYPTIELKGESIRGIITERQQQLDEVLRDISGLETVMDGIKNLRQQLVEKKDRIIQSMVVHKGLVSSLWRLPTEVLSQIFHHCLPEKNLSPASKSAPMLLTRICRSWREVAVGMPRLWCRLSVRMDNRDWEGAVVCYDLWLKRSQGRPLSLALEGYTIWHLSQLQDLLQPYINSISSLTITLFGAAARPEFLFEDLPALQELDVRSIGHYNPELAQSISRLPSTMRSLKVIYMKPPFDIERLSSFSPVWAHLTNIQIAICQPNAVLYLLQLCPNLSSLTIGAKFNRMEILAPLTHTKIQFLHIIDDSFATHYLSGLFDALSLPNLRVFIAYRKKSKSWPHEEFKNFLTRSNCSLERLIFSGCVTITNVQRAEYVALISSLDVVVDPSCEYLQLRS